MDMGQDFTPELARSAGSAVLCMAWCPNMDLLALALASGQVEVRRLSWQRLFDPITVDSSVTQLCWRPDGKVLAIGSSDGFLRLHAVESGREMSCRQIHSSPVRSLCWVSEERLQGEDERAFAELDARSRSFNFKVASRPHHMFTSLKAVPKPGAVVYARTGTDSATIERSPESESLDMLVSGDELGIVQLHALGTFPVGTISIPTHLRDHWLMPRMRAQKPVSFKILGVHMGKDMQSLSLVSSIGACNNYRNGACARIALDTSVFAHRKHELRFVAVQSEQIEFLVAYLKKCMNAISRMWKDCRRPLDMKFQTFSGVLRDHGEERSIADELMDMLVRGEPGEALHQFLSQYMSTQSMTRLRKLFVGGCNQVAESVRLNIQRAVEELSFRITELRSLAHWRERYAVLGLDVELLDKTVELSSAILMKCEEFQQRVISTRIDFLHFFDWIIKCVNKFVDEPTALPNGVLSIEYTKVARFIRHDIGEDRVLAYLVPRPLPDSDRVAIELEIPHLHQRWSSAARCSLATQLQDLFEQWRHVRESPSRSLSRSMQITSVLPLCRISSQSSSSVKFAVSSRCGASPSDPHQHIISFVHASSLYVVSSHSSGSEFSVSLLHQETHRSVVQLGFYNRSLLAVLRRHEEKEKDSSLVMLEFDKHQARSVKSELLSSGFLVDTIDSVVDTELEAVLPSRHRHLERVRATALAVCGERGVVSLLNGSNRVLIFDTENDEETHNADEEEEEEGFNEGGVKQRT